MLCSTNGRWKLEVWVFSCIHLTFWAFSSTLTDAGLVTILLHLCCESTSFLRWQCSFYQGVVIFLHVPFFPFCAKHLIARKKKQACLKKPSAFGDFLKIRSPQRSSIIKLEKMGKEPFWRKLPFLRMTKYGRKSWCRNSCDTIDIAYVLDICHRSPFILVLSLGPPKSSYLTHPSILLASTCFALL